MNTTIQIKAVSPEARSLLQASLGWIRRIEERADDLPPLFLDNIDVKPLRKKIEAFLATDDGHERKMVAAPAECKKCGTRYVSPTTGLVMNDCLRGGELVTVANERGEA